MAKFITFRVKFFRFHFLSVFVSVNVNHTAFNPVHGTPTLSANIHLVTDTDRETDTEH